MVVNGNKEPTEFRSLSWHIVVPDLHDTAGIFAPEVVRRSLIDDYGHPAAETAPQTAQRLAQHASDNPDRLIVIHGASNDRRACRVLCTALDREGLGSEIMIHRQEADRAPGRNGSSVERTGLMHVDEAWRGAAKDIPFSSTYNPESIWEPGASTACLQTPPLLDGNSTPGLRASPLPESLNLDEGPVRSLLFDLIARCWPARMAAWRSLLQADALAVNPIENVYAGQNLRDRNRDLMVNIL